MKKKIILLFMTIMMLTVTGCGGENIQQTEDSKNTGTQENENAGTKEEEYVKFPEFESTTISGDYVDSSIFSEADITMVNIWGTFCGPCINEMPDLAELYTELPTGCALVGVLTDVYSDENLEMVNLDTANQIVTETGVTYDNIIPDDTLYQFLAANITGVPTTLYVDSEGNILGGVVGARSKDEYKAILEELVKNK